MFSNIGKKIKVLAYVIFFLGALTSLLVAVEIYEDNLWPSIVVLILGMFLSWIANFLLYGFGQLINNSDKLVEMRKLELHTQMLSSDDVQGLSSEKWECEKCGSMVSEDYDYCPICKIFNQ